MKIARNIALISVLLLVSACLWYCHSFIMGLVLLLVSTLFTIGPLRDLLNKK